MFCTNRLIFSFYFFSFADPLSERPVSNTVTTAVEETTSNDVQMQGKFINYLSDCFSKLKTLTISFQLQKTSELNRRAIRKMNCR